MKLLAVLAIGAIAACGTDRAAFRPTSNVTSAGQGGQPAASYDIRTGPDQPPHVRVNVWSRGAYGDGDHTTVRMVMEVRNLGNLPVSLDSGALQLEAYRNSGEPLPAAQLVQTLSPRGSATVPAGEAATFQIMFAIPVTVDPDSIGSLRLRWALAHDDGRRYVQFTDFQRVHEYVAMGIAYYDPIYGFYDPFFGPPLGFYPRYYVPVQRIVIETRGPRPAPRAPR